MSKDLTDIRHVIDQMVTIKQSIKQLDERYNDLKAAVIDHLAGENEGLLDGATVVTNKTVTQYRVSSEWLKTNMPQVYETARQPVETSSFRLVLETRDV